jgi:GDP-L-fucose synthase
MKQEKILILGGSGNLGNYLFNVLTKTYSSVYAPSRENCDLLNYDSVRNCLTIYKPDSILFLAAHSSPVNIHSDHLSIFEENMKMGLNFLKALKNIECKFLLCANSASIYDESYELLRPYSEKDIGYGFPEKSQFGYGLSKKSISDLLKFYSENRFIFTNLVFTNLIGHTIRPKMHIIPTWIEKFSNAKQQNLNIIELWGSPNTVRDFLHYEDAAIAISLALEIKKCGNFNVGSNSSISLGELSEYFRKKFSYEGSIIWDNSKPNGNLNKSLNSNLFYKTFNFSPKYQLGEILTQLIKE